MKEFLKDNPQIDEQPEDVASVDPPKVDKIKESKSSKQGRKIIKNRGKRKHGEITPKEYIKHKVVVKRNVLPKSINNS